METILFIAHTEADGTISKNSREALAAALALRRDLSSAVLNVAVIGQAAQTAVNSIAACDAAKFWRIEGPDFSMPRYSTDVAALEAAAKNSKATIIIAAASSRMQRALPGACARLHGKIDTHIAALMVNSGTLHAQRWYYRQRMLGTFSRSSRPWFLLVDPGAFPAFQGDSAGVNAQELIVELNDNHRRTRCIGVKPASASTQTIRPDAPLLFVAGAGWTKKQGDGQVHVKDAEQLILGFIEGAGASLGSSKSLVDQGSEGQEVLPFLTHLNQVGQTGASPRHPKGLATCCHGEEPHVVGWRFINERRAINLDPNCGWAHGKADVLYVADAFRVLEVLNQRIKAS